MTGKFITFEGTEGSGKTTIIQLLKEHFEKNNLEVVVTREPGGIEISEEIRDIILDKKNVKMDEKTEALLYAASRRQHLVEKVIPNLELGKIVLCDRFVDSSLVYQGYARAIGIDKVYELNQFAINGFMPDLTIFFDVRPEVGLERIGKANRATDRLDLEPDQFHKDVYEGYHKLVEKYPERIIVVDAEKSIQEVLKDTLNIINRFLKI